MARIVLIVAALALAGVLTPAEAGPSSTSHNASHYPD